MNPNVELSASEGIYKTAAAPTTRIGNASNHAASGLVGTNLRMPFGTTVEAARASEEEQGVPVFGNVPRTGTQGRLAARRPTLQQRSQALPQQNSVTPLLACEALPAWSTAFTVNVFAPLSVA